MLRSSTLFWLVISLALPLGPAARADDEKKPPAAQDVAVCAQVTVTARYEGYGFTHLVTLNNTCKSAVQCEVWTGVDPAHLSLRAKPGQSESIATRKGSPSREVHVQSSCKLES